MNIDRKKLSLIFTGIGVVGTIVTNVITAKRTPKFEQLKTEEGTSTPKAFVKAYWPSLVSGAVTVGSIVLSEGLNLKEIGVLTGSVAYLVSQRQKILGVISEEDRKKIQAILDDTVDDKQEEKIKIICKPGPSVEETGRGDQLCYDWYSGRWFRSSPEAVQRAIFKFQERWEDGESLCLNDWYDELGIEATEFGRRWGYPNDPDFYDGQIDIEALMFDDFKNDNMAYCESVLAISLLVPPMEAWDEP